MWLVIGIGCLECRIESEVIGVFACQEEAEKVAQKHSNGESFYKPEFADYQIRIFQLPDIGSDATDESPTVDAVSVDWISVEDKKPTGEHDILLYKPDWAIMLGCYLRDRDQFWCGSISGIVDGVTHWMPMPNPPGAKMVRKDAE